MEAENGLKFYFQVTGRLFISNFSTGPSSLADSLIGDRKFWSGVVYTCFVSSKIPPPLKKSSAGSYTAFPQLGEVAVVGLAATLPKNSIPRSRPCGPKRDPHYFFGDVHLMSSHFRLSIVCRL